MLLARPPERSQRAGTAASPRDDPLLGQAGAQAPHSEEDGQHALLSGLVIAPSPYSGLVCIYIPCKSLTCFLVGQSGIPGYWGLWPLKPGIVKKPGLL